MEMTKHKSTRFLAWLLAIAVVCTMSMPTATAWADTGDDSGKEAAIENQQYDTLAEAVNVAQTDATVKLLKDVNVDVAPGETTTAVSIEQNITLDGNGHSITAQSTGSGGHVIGVKGDAQVTIKNLTVNGNDRVKHGIQAYNGRGKTFLDTVTVEKCTQYGIMVNGATVEAKNLTTVGNMSGVNVTQGSGVTIEPKFTLTGVSSLAGPVKILIDNSKNLDNLEGIKQEWVDVSGANVEFNKLKCYLPNDYNLTVPAIAWTDKDVTLLPAWLTIDASIGNTYYQKFADAIAAAKDNDTIVLQQNATADEGQIDIDKAITLDLNEKTLTLKSKSDASNNETKGLHFVNANKGIIKDGTIKDTGDGAASVYFENTDGQLQNVEVITEAEQGVRIRNFADSEKAKAVLTIDKDSVITATSHSKGAAVGVFGPSKTNYTKVAGLEFYGTAKGYVYGITGNGETNGTEIKVHKGAVIETTATDDGVAIYHPQYGKLNLDGGELKGASGIQMCAGEGEISDVKIDAIGIDARDGKLEDDGVVSDGAAIALLDRGYPGGAPKLTITGGNFTSKCNDTVIAYKWSDQDKTFGTWNEASNYLKIKGGTFKKETAADTSVQQYIAAGYYQDASTGTVAEKETQKYINLSYKGVVTDKMNEMALYVSEPNKDYSGTTEYKVTGDSLKLAENASATDGVLSVEVKSAGQSTITVTRPADSKYKESKNSITINVIEAKEGEAVPQIAAVIAPEVMLSNVDSTAAPAKINTEATDDIIQAISSVEQKEQVVVQLPVNNVELSNSIFRAEKDNNKATLVITTEKSQETDIPATFKFNADTIKYTNIVLDTGIMKTPTEEQSPAISSSLPKTGITATPITLAHEGYFPGPVEITIPVTGMDEGSTVYVYHVNKDGAKDVLELINGGKTTVSSEGTITFTLNHASDYVISSAPVLATKIKLNKTSASVTMKSTITLKATLTPAEAIDQVIWSSSNTKVAKVDAKGKVTGVAPGTATITAKMSSGLKATCKVTVKPKAPKLSVKAGKKSATAKWKKVDKASGYKVYRATSKNGKYKLIRTAGKSSTSYKSSGLKSKKTYYYKMRAYTKVNGKIIYSDYSQIVKVKVK